LDVGLDIFLDSEKGKINLHPKKSFALKFFLLVMAETFYDSICKVPLWFVPPLGCCLALDRHPQLSLDYIIINTRSANALSSRS